jgi:internalin A
MPKPKSILFLEQSLNVTFNEVAETEDIIYVNTSYSVNSKDEVTGLYLYGCSISDYSFIKKLKKLKSLDISYKQDADLSIITELPELSTLDISGSKAQNLNFLKELKTLKKLSAFNNLEATFDLNIFLSMPDLEVLHLGSNNLKSADILFRHKKLSFLNISNNQIEQINIHEENYALKDLDISSNKLKNIQPVEKIKSLERFKFNYNNVQQLAPVKNMPSLTMLSASNNNIEDLENLSALPVLNTLVLSGINLKNADRLPEMPNLSFLNVSDNNLDDLSKLVKYKELEELDIDNNPVHDFTPLMSFTKLRLIKAVSVASNNFSPLFQLPAVEHLDISKNNIQQLFLTEINKNITSLYISDNNLSDISFLNNLPNLIFLDLRKNQVSDISPVIPLVKKGLEVTLNSYGNSGIMVKDNLLDDIITGIINKGGDALIRHFERIEEQGADFIYEAKVTLVGEGSAGKTSLQKRLIDEKAGLPAEDNRTRGIIIYDWKFEGPVSKKYTAHIWDFGGQDVYFPVHRFFLTENSVFILLASTRQAENKHNFDYWIPTIFQFGGFSPIILGQTCHDGNKIPWNDVGVYLSNKNFNIIKTRQLPYYEINLPNNNEGLKDIKDVIISQIIGLPHLEKGVPKSWVPVRNRIYKEAEQNACISFERFGDLCRQIDKDKFLNYTDIADVASFLHSVGIILWYANIEYLRDWIILQPSWAMNAVYRIIDDKEIQDRRGIILSADLKRLWASAEYADKHDLLKRMLHFFKIAFPKRHVKDDYILPAKLLSIPGEKIWPEDEICLRLEYYFEFMPKGLINQLSAELSRIILSDYDVWNNAVNLKDENGTSVAQLYEDFHNRKIYIKAKGKDARGLIMIVMNAMKDVTDGYRGVIPQINVPCSCSICKISSRPTIFQYDKLLEWSEKRTMVTCNESGDQLQIDDLLFTVGLTTPAKEARNEQLKASENKPLKAFISYSKFDGESNTGGLNYLEEFKKRLTPLSQYASLIKTWDDTLLIAGDEWDEKIKEELKNADVIFLLISSNLLNTNYIKENELKIAIQRQERKECIVVPVVLSACGWQDIPYLSKLNGIPRKGNTIASWQKNNDWKNIDDAWQHIYEEVKKLIQSFQKNK